MVVAGKCSSIVVRTFSGRIGREITAPLVRSDVELRQAYVPAKVWCAHIRSKKLGVIMPVMRCKVYMGPVE